ncbi:MAG: chemotaxis protein CheX [Deltaproteobacteria bacterium]|nr:MAG: chemotaxis protein CheX [Deltaproteobacteria bacterium]
MDASIINPFISAAQHVLETMASVKARPGKIFLKKGDVAQGDVTGLIGLTGYALGSIAVTFEEACIFKIVTGMFGEPVSALTAEVADAVGELTNIISGQARRELEMQGKQFQAAVPSVVTGRGHTIFHCTDGPKIGIPFETDDGNFVIEVCLSK